MVEWVVELGTIGADPMRETSPPHLVRCFLVELFLSSSSTFHNDRACLNRTWGMCWCAHFSVTTAGLRNPGPCHFKFPAEAQRSGTTCLGGSKLNPKPHICPAEENLWTVGRRHQA